jgi:hypothetical protein
MVRALLVLVVNVDIVGADQRVAIAWHARVACGKVSAMRVSRELVARALLVILFPK